jgi:hypothetical protein
MPVFLSPGVFPREIDISLIPTAVGPLQPALIGTAQKGKVNKPLFTSTSEQWVNTFGNPFQDSYLGFAALGYFEQGNQAFTLRVGVECEEGQPEELSSICIDTSGANVEGWGRIPVFQGIDIGRLKLRECTVDDPYAFHDAAVTDIEYTDIDSPDSCGVTNATLTFTGTYTGPIDDTYIVLITEGPTPSSASMIDGTQFQVIRNSDGQVVLDSVAVESMVPGTSNPVTVGDGLVFTFVVAGGCPVEAGDVFNFKVQPNNRVFDVAVEGISGGGSGGPYTMPVASYTTNADFVTAFNLAAGAPTPSAVRYRAIESGGVPQIVTESVGHRIQLIETEGFALEVGTSLWAYDIPRSCLVGTEPEPFTITTANDRIKLNVTGSSATQTFDISLPTGINISANSIASAVDAAGVKFGDRYLISFVLQVADSDFRVVIATSEDHQFDLLQLMASYSNMESMKFAEEVGIPYPYYRNFRGFFDPRVALPETGTGSFGTIPHSCELDPSSADCLADSLYYMNIVGWAVAKSPGTWIDTYYLSLTSDIGKPGKYVYTVVDASGISQTSNDNISFDERDSRFIGNVVNEGSSIGGFNGDDFFNWEDRPAFLGSDPNDSVTFEVRNPGTFTRNSFTWTRLNPGSPGTANGIPTDSAFSSQLDKAIIGNPALSTGLYAFQNPDEFDVNVLLIPGVSSGAVIGQGLQLCEARGDMIYIVDPPYGLRPQQVVDWHNGLLSSDLTAAINSSYGALYWSWLKVFDQFSGQYLWVPPSGHIAGVYAKTARDTETWFAPAGLRRGHLLTPVDIEYNTTLGERNLLYGSGNAVNPIVKFTQDGITVWGQRTLQRKSSALDRVNVRMLLIYLKKNLVRLLRNYVFEPNDKFTRAEVVGVSAPFLADVQARRGLTGYKVVCDESNNTPERIDRNELWVSIFIKPTRAAEFIVLNLVILRTDQSFVASEVLAAGGVVVPA